MSIPNLYHSKFRKNPFFPLIEKTLPHNRILT